MKYAILVPRLVLSTRLTNWDQLTGYEFAATR